MIAEGVENKEQLTILSDMGCKIIQGYYFSKPLSLGDVTFILQNGLNTFFGLNRNEFKWIGITVIVSCLFLFGVIRYFLTGKQ